eukprot:gene5902-7600_t
MMTTASLNGSEVIVAVSEFDSKTGDHCGNMAATDQP